MEKPKNLDMEWCPVHLHPFTSAAPFKHTSAIAERHLHTSCWEALAFLFYPIRDFMKESSRPSGQEPTSVTSETLPLTATKAATCGSAAILVRQSQLDLGSLLRTEQLFPMLTAPYPSATVRQTQALWRSSHRPHISSLMKSISASVGKTAALRSTLHCF